MTGSFGSARERRLWLWTLAVVVGIYATLGLATTLADLFYVQAIAAAGFVLGMLLVAITVLMQGLGARPGGIEIGAALGVATVYAMVLLRLTMPERSHLIEYSVVAVLVYEALRERAQAGRRVPLPAALAVVLTSLVGVLDESLQLFIPSRVFDPVDVLFNALAALGAVVAMAALGWMRRWRSARRPRGK